MRLPDPNLPQQAGTSPLSQLIVRLTDYLRQVQRQLNQLTEGQVTAVTNAATAAPTAGAYAQGDFIRNSEPTEQGSGGSKYILFGWINVSTTNTPDWKECRFLTGN